MSVQCPIGHEMGAEHAFCPSCGLMRPAVATPEDAAVISQHANVGADRPPLAPVKDGPGGKAKPVIAAVALVLMGCVLMMISATHTSKKNTAQNDAEHVDSRPSYTCSAPATPECTAAAQAQSDEDSSRYDADRTEADSQTKSAHTWSVAGYLAFASGAGIGLVLVRRRFGSRQRAPRPVYVVAQPD